MKRKIAQTISVPQGINFEIKQGALIFTKNSSTISRKVNSPNIKLEREGDKIKIYSEKATKNQYKTMMAIRAHIKNIFSGLDKKFIYELEAVNVHFPMTLKLEGQKVLISNFLGEKTSRYAKMLPNVSVEIKGQKITVSSSDREAAGQTAANLENATIIKGRDRRIFQDGIFITSKPGRSI